MKKKLTYDFDEAFFRLMTSETSKNWEEADKTIEKIEAGIDKFLHGAETLYVGGGVNIHCDGHFTASLDTEHARKGYVLLNIYDQNSNNMVLHEAATIVLDADQRLKFKRTSNLIVSVKVKKPPKIA